MAADPLSPPGTEVVTPYMQRKRRYVPEEGHILTVKLPGESVRAEVKGVATPDVVLCELLSTPASPRSLGFNKGDLLNVRRDIGDHDIEIWRVITDHELRQQELQTEIEVEREKREDAAARERVQQIRERDLDRQAQAERDRIEREQNVVPPPDLGNWSA